MSLFYYAVNQFREEEYVKCVIQEPLMSTRYYAYEMFDQMLECTYQTDTLRQRCSYVLQHFFRIYSVEEIHSVGKLGTINNVETSYFTQLKMCYLMTTFRCPSDILITS